MENFNNFASGLESLATIVSMIIAGFWIHRLYLSQTDNFAHVEAAADIKFIGEQDGKWIVQLVTTLQNKGKVPQTIRDFSFVLDGLLHSDKVAPSEQYGGQAFFPHTLQSGSFLPAHYQSFFIAPGVTATYTFVASVPTEVSFLMLHSRFSYPDRVATSHAAECTVACPARQPMPEKAQMAATST